jgi:hypothetical protein
MKLETIKQGVPVYETPSCSVMELLLEGVLCTSGINSNFYHQGISGDDSEIF